MDGKTASKPKETKEGCNGQPCSRSDSLDDRSRAVRMLAGKPADDAADAMRREERMER